MEIHPDIENVARVLCRTRIMDDDDDYIEQNWRGFCDDAKCAILATLDAIREPTEAMVRGVNIETRSGLENIISREGWEKMIDSKKAEISGRERE